MGATCFAPPKNLDIFGSKTMKKQICVIEIRRTCLVLDFVVWTEMVFSRVFLGIGISQMLHVLKTNAEVKEVQKNGGIPGIHATIYNNALLVGG